MITPMPTREQLETAFTAQSVPTGPGRVRVICARTAPGVHELRDSAELDVDRGLVGDRWIVDGAKDPAEREYQVTMMEMRVVELVRGPDYPIHLAGDNLLVDFDLSEAALPVGTRLRVGTALLQVSAEPHAGCNKFRARFGDEATRWVNAHPNRPRRLRGINLRIVESGRVGVGDAITRDDRVVLSPTR
jgi:MOSC domain-containing protein YiiM